MRRYKYGAVECPSCRAHGWNQSNGWLVYTVFSIQRNLFFMFTDCPICHKESKSQYNVHTRHWEFIKARAKGG